MYLYDQFCRESRDTTGELLGLTLTYPPNYNFGYDVVDVMAAQAPEQRAMVWCNQKGDEKTFTFRDLGDLSSQCANALRRRGVTKGDKVLVILKRNYEYWFTAPALHKLGAVLVPATHMLTTEDLIYRINLAEISSVICTAEDEILDYVLEAQEECPTLANVFTFRANRRGSINLTAEMDQASPHFPRLDTLAVEPMIIYFTSGTTGYPKAVMHDHTYSLTHIVTAHYWQRVQEYGLHFSLAETGWGKASWGKIYGQWLCGCGVMVYDFEAFQPRTLLTVLSTYQVTSFCAPPTVYRYLVKFGMNRVDLSSLRHLTTAGEALNQDVFQQVKEQTGLELREGYGQTESSLMLAHLEDSRGRIGAMGKPTPLYQVALWDEEGTPVPQGSVGELVVIPPASGHQPGIFMGYYGDEELYEKIWRGGVYHTGDTAWIDEDGFYWYVGRADDVMKCNGFRVGPFEIENILMAHSAVLECAVTGEQNSKRGQIIKASVLLNDGFSATSALKQELVSFANQRLAQYKWIHKLEFVKEIPKTISGKIRRVELRQQAT